MGTHECTVIPQEICQLKFTTPREEPVPFMSKWCIDPNAEVTPDTTYDENDAAADPIGPEVTESSRPDALYGAPRGGPRRNGGNAGPRRGQNGGRRRQRPQGGAQ